MNGKLVGGAIVGAAVIAGAALYYLQEYYFYDQTLATDVEIRLVPVSGGAPETIPVTDMQAIDATSSPIRFRACFNTSLSLSMLTETYALYDAAEPLNAPTWFDCFDATEIGVALETGEALAFLSNENVDPGVDRVVAVFEDGRGYAWHQLNPEYAE